MPVQDTVLGLGWHGHWHVFSALSRGLRCLWARHPPVRAAGPHLSEGSESLSNLACSPGHRTQPPAVPAVPPALPGLPADGAHGCSHVCLFVQPGWSTS